MKTQGLPSRLPSLQPTPEHRRYARVLRASAGLGLLWLVTTFAAVAGGVLPARVPLQRLPELWGLPLQRFLEATATPTGWHWLASWPDAEAAMLLGVTLLAGSPVLCLLSLLPIYARRGDRAFLLICTAALAVLGIAASGVLPAAH